jgi:hypothetical protein
MGVVRHPRLWPTAIRQARRLSPAGWWRRPPFLPVPAKDYIEFRAITQYGETRRPPSTDDVVDYLAWCREWDRSLQ